MLMPVVHIVQTVDDAPNICPIKIKSQKKVKSAMRKEAMEQDQRDLSNQSDASESDERELELTPRQLLQLHSITPQVPKQRQFGTSSRPNLKQTAPKEVQKLTSDLTEEGTNVDFEVTERSAETSDKIKAPVYPIQNKNKTHKPSTKIRPTILDTTKNKAKVTKVVEITDMPKVSNIDKPSHPRIKKLIEILDTPELPVNTADQALTTETPPTTEFNRIEKVIQVQDPDSISSNKSLAISQTLISTSNVQKSKIPRFTRKKFELTKINDENETSTNQKGNDKTNELDDISMKASQQNPNSKIYPLRRRQKQKILGSEPNKGIN